MTCNDVTKAQADKLNKVLRRQLAYIGRLLRRMELRGFPPTDRLYQLVDAAYLALHHLTVEVHYLSCGIDDPGRDGHAPPPTLT
jgi:hypothetical protein